MENYIKTSLQKYYNLKNQKDIYKYLDESPNLFNLLINAAKEINKIFDENIFLTLVKKTDPEDNEFEYLTIFINTSHMPIKEARKLLKRFKFNWYFEENEKIDERIVFHVT